MSTASPRPDIEPEGLALAEAYERACRADVKSESGSVPARIGTEEYDRRFWRSILLFLDRLDAGDDLIAHIEARGPVETGAGIYKIDGIGRLRFHRHDHERTINREGNA